MYRVSPFIRHFAWALLLGIVVATLWVNLDPNGYYDAIEWRLPALPLGGWNLNGKSALTLVSLTTDVLMALFMFFLGKEWWEAHRLERGSLHGVRASAPLIITLGGLIGAAAVWLVASFLFETAEEATAFGGWTVPLGSDVVLCYLVGRLVFGAGSPALHVLLVLSIGLDISGLLLLGFAFPDQPLHLLWLFLPIAASVGVWLLFGRLARKDANERQHRRAMQLWPYMIAGGLSWIGVAQSGLPAALGLLPIIPAIPHADRAFGLFAEAEEFLTDPLNRFAHLLVKPLVLVLLLFGLTRGGIDLSAFAPTTFITLAALWIGKPIGVMIGGLVAAAVLGIAAPLGIRRRDMLLLAGISGMGFTVPVLSLETALPGGAMAEAARLGLAISLLAGPMMILAARRMR